MTKGSIADKKPSLVAVEEGKTYFWCSCGLSQAQPFCDGSHKTTDFKPLPWKAISNGNIAFCQCKQTDNPPLCDGSHRNLE